MIRGFEFMVNADLNGRTVVAGFPSGGLVGGIALEELAKDRAARRIGRAMSERVTPHAVVERGRALWPGRFYDAGPVLLLKQDLDLPPSLVHAFSRALAAFLAEEGVARLLVLDGLAVDGTDEEPVAKAYAVATDPELLAALERAGAPALDEAVLAGPSAALMLWAEEAGLRAGVIAATTRAALPDARAAAHALEVLNRVAGTRADVDALLERAGDLEREYRRLAREAGGAPLAESLGLAPGETAREPSMYT